MVLFESYSEQSHGDELAKLIIRDFSEFEPVFRFKRLVHLLLYRCKYSAVRCYVDASFLAQFSFDLSLDSEEKFWSMQQTRIEIYVLTTQIDDFFFALVLTAHGFENRLSTPVY